ncbi:dihydrolipoamide acetyltransferase family protein [Microbacterium sp. MAHUQ-60]|uniref:dihydrolipoamide acetyltransferase family protein n=1 Tax=unclassified Microbacterium TaxID=2609290 RepID=UPI00361EA6D0
MSAVVRMPQLAAGGTEAAIQTWLVAVGDTVAEGQAIVEIETEKAVVEHETEVAGVVAGLLVAAGDSTAVGTPIAVIAEPGETAEQALAGADAAPDSSPTAAAPAAGASTGAESAAMAAVPVPASDSSAQADPAAPAEATAAAPARLFASPLVRRLASENGIDLAAVAGSGPNGRIVRRDIDELLATTRAASPERPGTASAQDAAPTSPAPHQDTEFMDVPHTGMRRAIARRLVESKTTIPHFTLTADCRVDELIDLRARFGERTGTKPSVNDFVLKAVASALIDVPEANAVWTDAATRRFSSVDLAVAVSVDDGLVTPVLRGVERMSIGDIGRAVRELAGRGRAGRLKQSELEGGSFSVSNLGMYGTRQFSAIINPPHSGILAVGAAQRRPVVDDDGALSVATIMTVTLSADHRVLDGALAARWLAAFTARIENPLSLLL